MDEELKNRLSVIEEKLDKVIEYQNWEKEKWDYSGSFEKSFKTWASFYLASLLADETIGRNGTSNIFGNFK